MCQNQEQKQNQHKTRCGLCFFSTHFKSTMLLSWGMEVIGKIWEQVFWIFAEGESYMLVPGDLAENVILYLWTWADYPF